MKEYNNKQRFQLKPLAQAITVVCAAVSAGAVNADTCGAGLTTITTAVGQCILGDGESVDVNAANTTDTGISGATKIGGVLVNGTGIGAGSVDNSGYISASNFTTVGGVYLATSSALTGSITNSGSISAFSASSAAGIFLASSASITGSINNSGTLATIAARSAPVAVGIFLKQGSNIGGDIDNSGSIIGGSTLGTVTNSAAGILLSSASISGGVNNTGGVIQGNGLTSGMGISLRMSSSITSTITNNSTATIQGGSSLASGAGIGIGVSDSTIGSIDNSGIIQGSGTEGIGISLRMSSSITNTISNSGSILGGNVGILVNGGSDISGGINNSGTTGVISGGSIGIDISSSSDISGGISNSGSILGSIGIAVNGSSDISGGINNSGTTGVISGGSIGIEISSSSDISGGISNSGSILGGNVGILVNGGSDISGGINNNGGLISGSSTGIDISSSDISGGISNSGTISGGNVGISLSSSDISGGIDNSGTIKGATGTGIFMKTSAISGGITNNPAALISGSSYGINIINPTTAVSITNSGTITGGTAAINIQNGTLNLSGTGTISGAVTGNGNSNLNVLNSFTSGGDITGFTIVDANGNTVTVTGNFTMPAGATFQTTINSASINAVGKVLATGVATVPVSTTINVDVGAVTLIEGTTYTIVDNDSDNAGGEVTAIDEPTTITDDVASFRFAASVQAGDLVLTVEKVTSLVPTGTTGLSPNATAVSNAINNEFITSDPELTFAFEALTTAEEFNAALESMAPDMNGAVQNATFAAHEFSIATIVKRMFRLRNVGGNVMTGMAAGDTFRLGGVGMWIQGFGSTIDQDDRDGISGFDADTYGITFGADTLLTHNLRVGAAFSYSKTDVDSNQNNNSADIDSYQGALYVSYGMGSWYFDGIAAYAQNDYDSTRHVVVGTVNRKAKADFDADQYAIKGTVSSIFEYGDWFEFTPYASLHYSYLDTDGYTETGGVGGVPWATNLTVVDEGTTVLQSALGVSISKEMVDADGNSYVPEAHISWVHEYLDEEQTNTSTFTGGGAAFTTKGFDPASDSINAGVSLGIFSVDNIDVRASYDYEGKSDYNSHSGMVILRYKF